MRTGHNTPWGQADHVDTQYPIRGPHAGDRSRPIFLVHTPSHGGIFVPPNVLGAIPAKVLASTFAGGQGMRGWFEEDCDVAAVYAFLPDYFHADTIERVMPRIRDAATRDRVGIEHAIVEALNARAAKVAT
jgi:hypothetical protein